jgi:hypothetical protein
VSDPQINRRQAQAIATTDDQEEIGMKTEAIAESVEHLEMDREATARKKRELDGGDFQRLLGRLQPDSALAAQAYENLRRDLMRSIRNNNNQCSREADAEDLADRALDVTAKKLATYEIKNVNEYAFGVARLLLRKSLGKQKRIVSIVDIQQFRSRDENPEQTILKRMEEEYRQKCFLRCMRGLSPENQRLILEYYPDESWNLEQRRLRLAETLGIDIHALRMRMNRLRTKLDKCCARGLAGGKEIRQ